MKRSSFISLALLFGALLLLAACRSAAQPEAQAAAPPAQEEPATSVEVAKVETGDITLVFSYAGDLKSKDSVSIVPGVGGRVESLLVEVGDEVKAGDPIAVVKHDTYLAQLKQTEAGLKTAQLKLTKMEQGPRPEEIAAAQAAVQLARANLNDVANIDDNERTRAASALAVAQAALQKAQAEYDKIAWAGNVGQTQQAVALEQATIAYQTALANYNIDTNPSDSKLAPLMAQLTQAELNLVLTSQPYRQIDFDMAKVGVEQAQAAVDAAQLQLDEATVKAPFDGTVAELYVSEGSMVGPQVPVALFVSKEVQVLIDVEENRVGQVSEQQSASLRVAAFPGQDFPAVVTSVAPVADEKTHTFAVKITPQDEQGQLRSGMYADVAILAKEQKNAVLAPRTAVILLNNQETVFVVKEDNTVEQRAVKTGIISDGQVEILEGLQPGETVVTAGQTNLQDGAPVEIVTQS